ncbi:DNA ligase D [Flavobacterium piscis]|uniref:DNA ligase (ATP) n=1 Tax=Flavobacterium piscis TaxID=1114874 RepID=A0ABU1YBF9_9FLAO|nr:DNA ligase D [Flavobacterium piscis]MDR7211572.1 bifunctional non-homologous end joining protein LigD [Flavobacterium piscis]
MSLSKYNQKRNFKQTEEPKGKIGNSEKELVFVVQKHAASHLHYDFRLELDGVLKSWAVPKGPSMDPKVKRLAMMVEDHPYGYKDFEGSIPEGNYGAGNVIIWDNGTYSSADDNSATSKNTLKSDLNKGRLSFILKGKKLKGGFSLVKLKGKQENAWLLIKKPDKFATDKDILKKDNSVVSNKTLEYFEKKAENDPENIPKKAKSTSAKTKNKEDISFLKPMLATLTEEPFDNPDWIFENKYDGYRTISVINPNEVHLFSRNQLSFDKNFETIQKELKKINHQAILDGEIVVENSLGDANFQLLQNYIKTGKGILKYYVFDILNLDGFSTINLPLLERKELLKILLEKYSFSNILYSEHTVRDGLKQYKLANKNNNEGIIAKKADSTYTIGKRSDEWLKIKIAQQEEAVIIGITTPKNSRQYFGALLLGQYYGKRLQYIGKCGTGFSKETLKELYTKFKPHFINDSPINAKIAIRDTIQWLKPKFVCQVKFTEWTEDSRLRHPVFLGLRIDKKATEVFLPLKTKNKSNKEIMNIAEETKLNKTEENFDLKVSGKTLHLTNQNKIYFPESGITKGNIVQYYNEVADLILPYLKDRPQSMNRFPNGIEAPHFYQKDVDVDKVPSWLKTKKVYSESTDEYLDYLICNNKPTLLYMANLGCIDINPWNSTIQHIENPDWLVIDIDPSKDKFEEVVQTALAVKEVMDELETECYCKTSGASGLHVYIPLGAKYDYDSMKILAELIAREIQERLPKITSLERSIKKRNNKIYIDYLQNRRGQTLAAPYSIRPVPGAQVSTPLEWGEVNAKLSPSQFNIKNALKRFEKKGDLWAPVLGKGANIKEIMHKFEEMGKI